MGSERCIRDRFYSAGTFAFIESSDTSTATLTLKKSASGADSIDYLQCRDSSNNIKLVISGSGDIDIEDDFFSENSEISAPAINVLPPPVTITASAAESFSASFKQSDKPALTAWDNAFTGGLFTVIIPIFSLRS